MTDIEAILRWLVTVTVVGVAFAPLVLWTGRGLGSAAAGLIRPLALVFLTALVWWPAAALGLPFTRLTLALAILIAGLVGWALMLRRKESIPLYGLTAFETVWFALFLGYSLFRAYNPHIMNTEKPMEIAFLNSIVRSAEVPAPDPWFAGETINYYYFGYQMVGGIAKLSGVPPGVAFNLALATLFASAGTIVGALGYRLAQRFGISNRLLQAAVAAASTMFLLLAGNLETARRILVDRDGLFETTFWYQGVGWQASRVIIDHNVPGRPGERGTINEFPAFSFILGDLHPHVLTYPLLLAIVALAVGFLLRPETMTLPRMIVTGGLAGLLYVSNSWDAPLGILLLVIAATMGTGIRNRQTWTTVGIAAVAAAIAALPFLLDFTAPVGLNDSDLPAFLTSVPLISTIFATLGVVTWRPSSAGELLTVHGHWIVAALLFLLLACFREPAIFRRTSSQVRVVLGAAALSILIGLLWAPAVAMVGFPLAGVVLVAFRSTEKSFRIVAAPYAAGLFLVLVPEFIFIQDAFGDRMNTVFKLHFQAWALLAIAAAATLALGLASNVPRFRVTTLATIGLLILITLPYTPISARDWTDGFETRHGLDGSAWLERANPEDAAAITWLIEHAPADATIVEGPGCSYQSTAGVPHNRFSAFTGIPATIGWAGHQRQWRRGEQIDIGRRVGVRQLVANGILDGNPAEAANASTTTFLMLGSQERVGSADCEYLGGRDIVAAQAALEALGWQVVFEAGETRIMAQ